MEKLHANTLEIPVAWEQIEPVEGRFDFSYVDTLLKQSRAHGLRLVLLWFGAYKNTSPSYTPSWVKRDHARFPHLVNSKGETWYALTPIAQTTADADSKAFAALMRRVRCYQDDQPADSQCGPIHELPLQLLAVGGEILHVIKWDLGLQTENKG